LCSVIASTGPPAAGLSSQQLLAVVVVILGHCFVLLPFCAFAFEALKEIGVHIQRNLKTIDYVTDNQQNFKIRLKVGNKKL